jgi:hypothetical protein
VLLPLREALRLFAIALVRQLGTAPELETLLESPAGWIRRSQQFDGEPHWWLSLFILLQRSTVRVRAVAVFADTHTFEPGRAGSSPHESPPRALADPGLPCGNTGVSLSFKEVREIFEL